MPSIEQRGIRSWRLIVEDPNSSSKKREQQKKTIRIDDDSILNAPTKLQKYLNMELVKFQMEVESGNYIKIEKYTFEEFYPIWHKNYAQANLGGYTIKNYKSIIKSQLLPEFGSIQISRIKTIAIVNFFTKLRSPEGRKDGKEKPLANNTLLNIYTVLKSMFDCAEKWGYISQNPMDGVQRPIASKKEKREFKTRKKSLTPAEACEVILILSELPMRWSLYFIGIILGAFRRGEMTAIEWPNVDFKNGGFWITKQISFTEDGEKTEAEVKTVESEGFVPMPLFYMNSLLDFKETWFREKENAGEKWCGGDKQYLFHAGLGEMFYPNAPTRYWGRLRKKYNLPNVRLHDLRHTTAMLLREEAASMKDIQERLRHARMETTTQFYVHDSDQISRRTADLLEKYNPRGSFVLGTDWEQKDKKE